MSKCTMNNHNPQSHKPSLNANGRLRAHGIEEGVQEQSVEESHAPLSTPTANFRQQAAAECGVCKPRL